MIVSTGNNLKININEGISLWYYYYCYYDRLKKIAENEPTPLQHAFQIEQANFARQVGDVDTVASLFPQYETVASGLYKRKNKNFPPLPNLVSELSIDGDFKLTECGNRFLLTQTKINNNGKDEHVLIFCSDIGLKVLAESKRWHSDGTFDTAVQFKEDKFQQFYLIHGLYKGHMIPCAFSLLTNKSTATYRCMLSELKDGASRIKLVLKSDANIWNK